MLRYLPLLLILAVWIYAFIDCLNTPESEVRKLPKIAWVLIVLLFGQVLVGPIAWFVVGRPRRNAPYGATRPQERRWVAPDDNPEFLKSLGNGRTDSDDKADSATPDGVDETNGPESQPAEDHPDTSAGAGPTSPTNAAGTAKAADPGDGERSDAEHPHDEQAQEPCQSQERRPDSGEQRRGAEDGGPDDTPPAAR